MQSPVPPTEAPKRPLIALRANDDDQALFAKLRARFPLLDNSQIIRLSLLALAAKEGIAA